MRVILEIIRGPHTGKRKLLTGGDSITVGRSEFSDFPSEDSQMSREHFRLTVNDGTLVVEDLNSRNGTLIEGEPIHKPAIIEDGTKLTCGQTHYKVFVQGGTQLQAMATQSGFHARTFQRSSSAAVMKALKGRLSGEYQHDHCLSGFHRYSGDANELTVDDIAELISRKLEVYFLLDCNKTGIALDDLNCQAELLFDFMDPAAAAAISPVIVPAFEIADWPEILKEAWGSDGIILLFVRGSKQGVLSGIRNSMQSNQNGGLLGICWPKVLDSVLTSDQSGTAAPLMELAEVVMVESPDGADTWRLYSRVELSKPLNNFGLKEAITTS